MAGTVSHISTDLFFGAVLLFAGFNAGKFGLDRCVIPLIKGYRQENINLQL